MIALKMRFLVGGGVLHTNLVNHRKYWMRFRVIGVMDTQTACVLETPNRPVMESIPTGDYGEGVIQY